MTGLKKIIGYVCIIIAMVLIGGLLLLCYQYLAAVHFKAELLNDPELNEPGTFKRVVSLLLLTLLLIVGLIRLGGRWSGLRNRRR